MKLDGSTLPDIPIAKPTYARGDVSVGIVHFGVGGFHRAHQAMYVDALLEKGLAAEWGICGVGVLPGDRKMADALGAQDGLYTLLLEKPDGTRDARVIGSIVDYRYAPDDPEGVVELLAAPSTRIVSLTITEGGYEVDKVDADSVNVFGLITDALALRRDRGSARRRSCRATTSRATATWPARRSCATPTGPIPACPSGSARTRASPTRWSTASPR